MELIDAAQPGLLVRVIPDASKDIGLNSLAAFPSNKCPCIVNCATLAEAAKLLAL